MVGTVWGPLAYTATGLAKSYGATSNVERLSARGLHRGTGKRYVNAGKWYIKSNLFGQPGNEMASVGC
jgi:hypothetical protein